MNNKDKPWTAGIEKKTKTNKQTQKKLFFSEEDGTGAYIDIKNIRKALLLL